MNWKSVKLGDVLKTGAGGTPLKSKKEYYENGNINWLLSGAVCEKEITQSSTFITNAGLKNSSAKLFPPNTVLVAMYGATAGQVGILRVESATNQAVCGIYPDENYLPEFLYYFLLSYKDKLLEEVSGVAQPNLSQVKIKNTSIPLLPLPVQKQIVEKLDAAFADIDKAISTTEKNIENAESLFFSHLNSFFNRENAEWSHLTLQEAANFIDYRGKTPKKTSEGVRLITAKNIKMGYIKTQPEEFISEESYQERMTRGFPKIGDIFFTTEAPLGNVAQLNINEKISPGQRIITLQPDASRLNNTFFKYILMSEIFQNEIKNNATGATVSGIKASLLKKIAIFFPSSKQEQKEIAEKLQESEKLSKKLMNLYLKKKDNYESLKSSILTQAFSGKFTKDAA